MKKHLLILLILLCTISAFGQNKVSYAWARKTDTAYTPGSWLLDSVMRAKYYASADSNKVLGVDAQGYFVLRTKSNAATVDSSLYATVTRLADTSAVLRSLIGTGGLDTTSISNRIDARVKYTDTAAMLTPYALLTEIPSITGKVNYTDTAAMLSPYLRKADTTAMLAPYATEANLADTAAVLRGLIPTGTDTTSLSNRIDARVNYTDTATMLAPYLRKADTSTLSARINLKQNYTDTLTWDATKKNLADTAAVLRGLIPAGTDTTSLSNRIDARVKYTDTAAMLTPYLRKVDTTAMLGGYLRKVDTSTLSNRINLKANIVDTANKWVGSITRTPGKDSIIFFIGSTRYAIKDSVGSGGGSTDTTRFWNLDGNIITNTSFIGSKNNFPLRFRVNNTNAGAIWGDGQYHTYLGFNAGGTAGNGLYHTSIGTNAFGAASVISVGCVALGFNAFQNIADATYSVAVGFGAGKNNATGAYNYVIGGNSDVRASGSNYGNIGNVIWSEDNNGAATSATTPKGRVSIGTNNPNDRALLELSNAGTTKGGFKLPEFTTTDRDAITWVAGDAGMMIWNTTTTKAQVWTGSAWVDLH